MVNHLKKISHINNRKGMIAVVVIIVVTCCGLNLFFKVVSPKASTHDTQNDEVHSSHHSSHLHRPFSNVALMGQFNYALESDKVAFWVQHWRTVFDTIVVRGPFTESQIQELQTVYGIPNVYYGEDDRGYYSPVENLRQTLLRFQESNNNNDTNIEGVIYMHDDGIINITELTTTTADTTTASQNRMDDHDNKFPTNKIIANGNVIPNDFSYLNPRSIATTATTTTTNLEFKEKLARVSFRIYPNGTISNVLGQSFDFYNEMERIQFYNSLKRWQWWSRENCVPALVQMALEKNKNNHSIFLNPRYREKADGSFLISPYVQGDFLFVPTKYASIYSDLAKKFVKAGVFLECAFGTIVDLIRQQTNVSVRKVNLCTGWAGSRGMAPIRQSNNHEQQQQKKQLILELNPKCKRRMPIGYYHPIKMGNGLAEWEDFFNLVTAR